VEGDFTDDLNSSLSVSLRRPSADVPLGEWIPGRVTFYGAGEGGWLGYTYSVLECAVLRLLCFVCGMHAGRSVAEQAYLLGIGSWQSDLFMWQVGAVVLYACCVCTAVCRMQC
jgi:hypothetical protein